MAKLQFSDSLKSRKFLLAVVAAFVAFANSFWNWGLTVEQIWQFLTPVLAWVLAEAAVDLKRL